MTAPIPEHELMRALAVIVHAHQCAAPTTAAQLGVQLGLSRDSGFIRRDHLAARGLVELIVGKNGAIRIHPTAAARRTEAPVPTHKRRPCMRCRTEFLSDGPHHRHCNRCRNHLSDLDGAARYAP